MVLGIYVEVVDLDGIKHHIGPFKERSNARDWIAQNSRDGNQVRRRRGRRKDRSSTPLEMFRPKCD